MTRFIRWMAIGVVLVVVGSRLGTTASAEGKNSSLVKRGQYLVEVGGCGDCHTPWIFNKELNMPVPDLSRRLRATHRAHRTRLARWGRATSG